MTPAPLAYDTFAHEDAALVEAVARQLFDGAARVRAWRKLPISRAHAYRMRAAAIIRTVHKHDAGEAAVKVIPHLGRVS